MRACAMIAVAYANGAPHPYAGQYLKTFDADAYDGRGYSAWTGNLAEAMRFADAGAALSFWKTKSRIRPLRIDGKPNRPLTAITTLIVAVDLEGDDPL